MQEAINIIGQGINDPHIRIFNNNRAYLYASHDHSVRNDRFVMRDWQVWSSDDLLNWRHESTLRPEDTYIGKPIDGCWATDTSATSGSAMSNTAATAGSCLLRSRPAQPREGSPDYDLPRGSRGV